MTPAPAKGVDDWVRRNESLWHLRRGNDVVAEVWLGDDARWHIDADGDVGVESRSRLTDAKRRAARLARPKAKGRLRCHSNH